MYRRFAVLMLSLVPVVAGAASPKDQQLGDLLEEVARKSSVGTPRAINEDILDRGYSVDGNALVNHLSVQPRHAAQMRDNPSQVRTQLDASVCNNDGLRTLLGRGATLRFEFSEYKSDRPIATERYSAKDCGL
ncbi:PA3611 family quorum-sensing-regulated virulence factor [Pseudomonas oligotrophica]|uniref:PA3611 family quorum-sensing-regulated virulence factor n=1 Tax=Pseudomonas oligotrophica TaxID=2912055 RepID=UPI001F28A7D6|nr:PA3611 family quorum-sensing-regulated virulence factor [Pseudomonas oligotrophica]MCF7203043.1 quorum-sensing-regulated virulence factor family protein [Pseudomonas oligotrophica]